MGAGRLVPTYKQLKTLALSLRGELPGHWNDFTIPDNDGSAQKKKRFGPGSPQPPCGEFQKDQAFPTMTLGVPQPDPHLSSPHGYFRPSLMAVTAPDTILPSGF